MIKKIILVLIFCSVLLACVACGKKADPEYKAQKDNIAINMI